MEDINHAPQARFLSDLRAWAMKYSHCIMRDFSCIATSAYLIIISRDSRLLSREMYFNATEQSSC